MGVEMDFDRIVEDFKKQSSRGRLTLLYRLVQELSPLLLRVTIRYCGRRIDVLHSKMPDSDPDKKFVFKPKINIREVPTLARQDRPTKTNGKIGGIFKSPTISDECERL